MRRAPLLLLLAASAAHARPCASELLAAATHTAWGVDNLKALDCKPLRASIPLLLVQARLDDEGKAVEAPAGATGYAAIIDPATGDVWWHRESYAGTPGIQNAYVIADLDRDGRDELLEHETYQGHMGFGSETLRAYAIRDGATVDAGTLGLALSGLARGASQNGCSGTWAIVGGPRNLPRIQIVGARLRDEKLAPAPDVCPLDGTHRYRWTGAAFALAD